MNNAIKPVSTDVFRARLEQARSESQLIADNTISPDDSRLNRAAHWLAWDQSSGLSAGFSISSERELIGLFSNQPGNGDALVRHAVGNGAKHLNCFDVPALVKLYNRHGFYIVDREPNYSPTGPDVVYMVRIREPGEVRQLLQECWRQLNVAKIEGDNRVVVDLIKKIHRLRAGR